MYNNHPLFEIVSTTLGVTSIRNKLVNEVMHCPVGPWQEANELYINQSDLAWHLNQNLETELVIYDVGLGAAANALATLHCAKSTNRPIRLISFEIDLELLKFALFHSSQFDHFRGYESAIESILKNKFWKGSGSQSKISWELHEGNFLDCIDDVQHKAHIIYYDPYSPKVNNEMWTTHCFKKLWSKCQTNATFYNYSQATPIRVALLEAGFYVGYGIPIGEKQTTTQAACKLQDLKKPLDERWLQRWKRSKTQLPIQCENADQIEYLIKNHEQFKSFNWEKV